MPDTLEMVRIVHDTVRINNTNTMDVLNKVDAFYNHSWNNLLTIGAIIGVVIPLLYALYQRRLYILNKKELSEEINRELAEIKETAVKEVKNSLDSIINELETKINRKIQTVDARHFHLQGSQLLDKGDYKGAFRDYCYAASAYNDGEDYLNLQSVLSLMYLSCLPQMSKKDYNDLIGNGTTEVDPLIEKINNNDSKSYFTQHIRNLKQAINDLNDKLPMPPELPF